MEIQCIWVIGIPKIPGWLMGWYPLNFIVAVLLKPSFCSDYRGLSSGSQFHAVAWEIFMYSKARERFLYNFTVSCLFGHHTII